MCGSKKSRFINKQNTNIILSSFGLKTVLKFHLMVFYKVNDIGNKFLLAEDKFLPEMHLKKLGFTYRVCGTFTKNKERIKKFWR